MTGKIKNVPAAVMAAAAEAGGGADDPGLVFAGEYVEVYGVRLYRPKVAHQWLIMELARQAAKPGEMDMLYIMTYLLLHDVDAALNRLTSELRSGALLARARAVVGALDVPLGDLMEAVKVLAEDLDGGKKKRSPRK